MATRYLYPTAITGAGSGFSGVVGSIDDPYDAPNDVDYVSLTVTPGSDYFQCSFDPLPASVVGITSVRAVARAGTGGAAQSIVINDFLASTSLTGSPVTYAGTATTNPDTSLPWTPADVNALRVQITISADDEVSAVAGFVYQFYLEVITLEEPQGTSAVRDALSRRFWTRRKAPFHATVALPAVVGLNANPIELLAFSHILAPHDTDDGWREAAYQRRPVRLQRRTYDPMSCTVQVQLRDERPILALHVDSAHAALDKYGEGIVRFDRGGTRTFARTGPAWFPAPLGGLIAQVEEDQEEHAEDGDLFHGERTCEILNSAFSAGSGSTFTNWTATAGTGTIAEETSIIGTDPGVSTRCPKFTAHATSHTGDCYLQAAAIAKLANEDLCLHFLSYDTSAQAASWLLQRSVDSWYWNDTSGAWQAGAVWNLLTNSQNAWGESRSKAIDVGGSNTNLTLRVGLPSGATAASVCRVQWAEEQDGAYPAGFIKTTAAAVTRYATSLTQTSNSTARRILPEGGATSWRVRPFWNSADIGNTNRTVFYLGHDANNYEWLYYDGTIDRWVYEVNVATTVSRAVLSGSVVAGTEYLVSTRRCTSAGEHGLAAYTCSIFVDATKGTDVTPAAAPTAAASVNLEVGSRSAAEHWDGSIRRHICVQYVPNDVEMGRLF